MDPDDELKLMLTYIFNLKRCQTLSRLDIEMAGSIEMRWFTPGQMGDLVDLALREGLLSRVEGGKLKPTFEGRKVPMAFKPSDRLLEWEKDEDLVKKIAAMLAEPEGLDVKSAIKKMSRLGDEMNIHICAAGLALCAEKGIDIEGIMGPAVERVKRDLAIEIRS
jgi:hypothetical protein